MPRMHVNLRVSDLERSVAYYTKLWNRPPTKRRDEYAKWSLAEPAVNFALTVADAHHPAGVEHLGVEVTEQTHLSEALTRAEAAGEVFVEGRVTCCYADSSKGWARDPDGVAWELFLTHGDAEERGGGGPGGTSVALAEQRPVGVGAGERKAEACCASDCCS